MSQNTKNHQKNRKETENLNWPGQIKIFEIEPEVLKNYLREFTSELNLIYF